MTSPTFTNRGTVTFNPVTVETYLTLPFHPTITPLSDSRWLVAFGSTEGIVAAIFCRDG